MSNEKPSQKAPDYFINTAPEMDALERAAADGKHGRNYSSMTFPRDGLSHAIPGASHSVRLMLTEEEATSGVTTAFLESLVSEQDADAALAFLYVARLLAPPLSVPDKEPRGVVIEIDDVIEKIGWIPRNTADRIEKRKRVYQFLLFGARAHVVGSRRGAYKDRQTGEVIDTVVESALWYLLEKEWPAQQSLFPSGEVPVKVEMIVSRQWAELLTAPRTAQYLPMGELLGAIPGSKPSGAWARVIGLALASFWRRNPRESLDGSLKPTRRELLTRYPPKTGTVEDLLATKDPRFAIDYWCAALQLLCDSEFIEATGEAMVSPQEMKAKYPRKDWGEAWLDERVLLMPAKEMREAVSGRAKALPATPIPRRRGRPKKATS